MPLTKKILNDIYKSQLQDQLHINMREVSLDDMWLVCDFLNENPQIKTLGLVTCGITDASAKLLARNKTISSLDMSHNLIENDGVIALAKNPNLESLNLESNCFGTDGVKALADNESLISLEIGGNVINDEGAIAIAKNRTIRSLDVAKAYITSIGAKALAQNNILKELDISDNKIGKKGIIALLGSKSIIDLLAVDTGVWDIDDENILAAFKKNHTLFDFNYGDSLIDKILKRNHQLPSLQTSIKNAHFFKLSQKQKSCPLGTIPKELMAMINDYAIGKNHNAFFLSVASKSQVKEKFQENALDAIDMIFKH
jgi:Leucine Rich repeat